MGKRQKARRNNSKRWTQLESLEGRHLMAVLSIADITVPEGIGEFDATFQLTEAVDSPVTIFVSTASITAEGDKDYEIEFVTLTIPAGQLSTTTQFGVIDDSDVEMQEEFKLVFFPSDEVSFENNQAIVTIIDNDTPKLSVDDVTTTEGEAGAIVSITISSAISEVVSVGIFSSDGTAKAGDDFVRLFQAVRIPAGETKVTVEVPILNDAVAEVEEFFTVNLLNPSRAELADASAIVTIRDNDGVEFRSLDGTGNNLDDKDRGAARTQVIRFGYPAGYVDDIGDDMSPAVAPNARDVSNALMAQDAPILNDRNLSDWIVQWGQFITHDMALVNTGAANNVRSDGTVGDFGIPITDLNDQLGPRPIPFNRSDFAPDTGTGEVGNDRQQVNQATSYIDASQVYGSDETRATALRTLQDGKMKTSSGNLLPLNEDGLVIDNMSRLPDDQLFIAGDPRANEATGLIATHTLFLREHNRLADLIKLQDPSLNDEAIYQWARRIVSAEIQKVTYEEFLPALMGNLAAPDPEDYEYNPGANASITNSFTAAFFRFGHSMQSSNLILVDDTDRVRGQIPLREAFFNPRLFQANPELVDFALKGLASQVSQENDVFLVDDIRNFLFGPPGAGGVDLGALDVQRGRDHGLIPFNQLRPIYAASVLTLPDDPNAHPFSVLSSDPHVQETLQQLYASIDNVEAFVGGIAEDHVPGSSVGEMLQKSLQDQFTRLRDGDRFFYAGDNALQEVLVTSVVDMKARKLADIIRDNTSVTNIQDNVFFSTTPELDFGDAPAPYPTSLARDGARHQTGGPALGFFRSAETDGKASTDASADNDDDGVDFRSAIVAGTRAAVTATVFASENAKLDGWIDFNNDGDWNDSGEHVIDSVHVTDFVGVYAFDVPANATAGPTFSRFRVSTDNDLDVIGLASDGEVEDYRIVIQPRVSNLPPTANADVGIVVTSSQVASIAGASLLANDFDPDGDAFSISGAGPISLLGAKVTLNGDGGVSYDPTVSTQLGELPSGDTVVDRLTYEITDSNGLTSSADVSIQVHGTNSNVSFPSFHSTSAIGTGTHDEVDLADLDGDGDLDAFLTRRRLPDEVWLNNGLGEFENSGQSLTRGAVELDFTIYSALADMDNDGDIDAAVASPNGVAIWTNDGQGHFSTRPEPATATQVDIANVDSIDVALGDLNGDGHVDLYVARNGFSDQIWLGDGAGDFDLEDRPAGDSTKSVELADLDGDGDLDAIVGAHGPNRVFKNLGNGTFEDSGQQLGDGITEQVAVGDLDGDGDLDAFSANAGNRGEANRVWFNNGSGRFSDSGQRLGLNTTSHVALADLDNDGDLDAYTANWFEEDDQIWINLGNGFFIDSGLPLEGQRSSHVGLGDIDNDGDVDAVVASFADEPNRVWINSPNATNPDTVTVRRHTPPEIEQLNILANDNAGSAQLTVVSVNDSADRVVVGKFGTLRWEPDGRVTYLLDQNNVTVNTLPEGQAVVDTFTYTATAARLGPSSSELRVTIPGTFRLVETLVDSGQALGGDTFNVESLLADFDNDGDQDWFVSSDAGPDQIWVNDGAGNFSDSGQRLGNGRSLYGAVGDVDRDGDVDIVVASLDENLVWLNDGLGDFTSRVLGDSSTFSQDVVLDDFDSDGDLDIFLATGHADLVLFNDGNGRFTQDTVTYGNGQSTGVEAADLNKDGRLDIVVSSRHGGNSVWLNVGNGRFQAGQAISPGGEHVTIGDIDGDGDADLVVASNGPNRIWVNQGDGSFLDSGQRLSDVSTSHVQLGDLDNDGDLDLVAANFGAAANDVLLNDGQGLFVHASIGLNPNTKTEHIAIGDLNGDGDLDAALSVHGGPNLVYMNLFNSSVAAPTVVASTAIAELGSPFHVSFDQDVSASLDATDIKLIMEATGETVSFSAAHIVWDAENNRAEFSTTGIAPSRYDLVLEGHGITNPDGVALRSDGVLGGRFTQSLTIAIPGDANLDVTTSFTDFLVLAQNFGRSDAGWTMGDFDADGDVDFIDVLIFANNFGRSA